MKYTETSSPGRTMQLEACPTSHKLIQGDARNLSFIGDESVHLVVTSPPYWTLKRYNDSEGQLGHVADYEKFVLELRKSLARNPPHSSSRRTPGLCRGRRLSFAPGKRRPAHGGSPAC